MPNQSATPSVTNETREVSEPILKKAIVSNLDELDGGNNIHNTTTLSDTLLANSEGDNESNKSFLLRKFLQNSSEELNVNEKLTATVIKPIPKPRKFKNNLAGKVTNLSCNSSTPSDKTYIVGCDTNKDIFETVDVIIHDNPISSCTSKSIRNNSSLDKTYYVNNKIEISDATNITLRNSEKCIDQISNVESKVSSGKSSNIIVTDDKKDADESSCDYKYDKIAEIIIHKADTLQLDSYVTHPTVKVHIVDINNGKYYPKSKKSRSVVFYYENEEQDYILPVMTSSFNLQEKRTFSPEWEESILLNEDFGYLTNENIIIFFEVLDYVPHMYKTLSKLQKNSYKGWRTITFAFLKLVGKSQSFNINKKVKLQLYYPVDTKRRDSTKCDLWDLWKSSNKLKKYPSALYVTVRGVNSPKKVIETFRSKTPLQRENLPKVRNYEQCSQKCKDAVENGVLSKAGSQSSRETFELPNKLLAELDSYDNGCFLLKFSNNGLYLACSVQVKGVFVITVYSVNSFEEVRSINEHRGLIYSINWSLDDSLLITASADNTVVIWNYSTNCFSQILPHPIYVYTSHISYDNAVIATGCYDATVRIWLYNIQEEKYELHQEMEKHEGYITCVCFNYKSTNLYSSDSTGHIFEWSRLDNCDWQFERNMSMPDLRNTVINEMMLFPNARKMLVHSRDSVLRIISVKRACVLFWLQGALNFRVQTFCSISSCGSYVTSGSENGLVVVWDAKTGKDIMTYEPFINHLYLEAAHCARFHPKDNIIAFSHYGGVCPILLYHYNVTKEDLKQENVPRCLFKEKYKTSVLCDTPKSKENKMSFYDVLEKMDKLLN